MSLRPPAGVARGSGSHKAALCDPPCGSRGLQLATSSTTRDGVNGSQAPRLPLAKHNRCIMFPPAGRLRSARGAVTSGSGARGAARTVSPATRMLVNATLSPATPCSGARRLGAGRHRAGASGGVRRVTPHPPPRRASRPPVATPYRRPRCVDAPTAVRSSRYSNSASAEATVAARPSQRASVSSSLVPRIRSR
jgi:hypothetical protein